MNPKTLGLCIVVLLIAVAAAGCTDDSSSTAGATTAQATAAPTTQPLSFSGSGDSVTDAFTANGFTTFTATHSGDHNFVVRLLDADSGKLVHLLVNEIGDYSGQVAKGLDGGTYKITITADGPWSVTVK